MAQNPSPNAVLVDLNSPTGQIVHGTEFGLSTSMGDGSHDYLPYGDPSFYDVADQYPVDLLRHNWELNTFMDIMFPSRSSTGSPDFTNLDHFLDNQANFQGFFNNNTGMQVVTLGFPSWMDISNSSDQALYGQMVGEIAQHFAAKGMPVHYWELVNEPDGHYSATDMANIFNVAANALKSVDPANKLGGLTESWYHADDAATFFNIAGPNIGFISWHQYVTNGSDGKSAQQEVTDSLGIAAQAQSVRAQATAAGIPTSVPLFLGEYNIDGGNYSDPNNGNMVGAVGAAATTYGMITSNANMTMGALWETLNDGSYNVFGAQGNYAADPVAVTLSTLSDYMPGNLVQTTMPSNAPGLVGYTTTYGGGFATALIDTNLSQGYTVNLSQGNLPTTGLTRVEISDQYQQGNKTAITDLSNVTVPAGSIVIITNEAPHGGVVYDGGAAPPPVATGGGSGTPVPPAPPPTQTGGGTSTPPTQTGGGTASPDNTVITASGGGAITDASGNTWSIANGQVAVNGTPDGTTANVTELAYEKGLVWQENSDNLWWSKSTPSDTWSPGPGTATSPVPASSTPTPPPSTTGPTASPDNTVITASGGGAITDASGNTWSIANGQVAVNGTPDGTTANVTELAYEKGLVWQENSDNLWWSKSTPSDTWSPGPGTATSPVPSATVSADQLTLALSEDAYQGDAQFIVKMDGTQLGSAQSVTASNADGKTQDFTFSGNWGAGTHNVEIDFINDAYAGPGQDRNLTIDQVTYDGVAAMSQPSTLWSNGGVTIAAHS